ncbi:MAG TPA: ATP-dependent Clp protease proteolytic subunit [Candidatus Paceibacterota bacterium]|nr:ATP-dependent Clp protease proteolytic subunit [Candidatus Paceibacterota bacterium]
MNDIPVRSNLPPDQATAEQLLLAKGIILIFGEINDAAFEKLSDQLLLLEAVGSPDIEVRFDSTGGDTLPGFLMYDLLRLYKGKTTGVITHEATSIASVVFQGCAVRKIFEHGWIHIHTPTSNDPLSLAALENAANIKDLRLGLRKCCGQMLDVYENRARCTREQIRGLMDEDRPLFAEEALNLGFVDEII